MKKSIHAWGWLTAILFLLTTSYSPAVGYTLTVVAQGPGVVARNPSNATYPAGVVVTVTATPNTNSTFTGWSGDTNGTVNPLNVTMNSSLVITGNFSALTTYAVTLTTNGQGGIVLSPAGSYTNGSGVTATATPSAGWVFTGWSGFTNSSANPLTFTVTNNLSLAGNFAQLPAFDVQPANISTGTNSLASVIAHAVGTAPLVYQWNFSGGSLPAATTNATLTLTNVQLANAGNYFVVATNAYGSATSSVVSLVLTNLGGSANAVNLCNETSLRAAIATGGWVSLHCSGTFTLTNTITISNNVILDATGVNATISGGNLIRIFNVTSNGSLTATNLTLANGSVTNVGTVDCDGGAIYNDAGTVNLVGCALTSNTVHNYFSAGSGYPAHGGVIFNNGGAVRLINSIMSGNTAIGGVSGATGAAQGYGGAIYTTNGTLNIFGSSISNNQAASFAGGVYGGAIYQASGICIISNTTFTTNLAYGGSASTGNVIPAYGGALAVIAGTAVIDHCVFGGNVVRAGVQVSFAGSGFGGAIYSSSTMTLKNSTLCNNQSLPGNVSKITAQGTGGAIHNSGSLTLDSCCIFSNYVIGSAGTFSQGVYSIAGNGLGGGIFNAAQLNATNCTIALNTAESGHGYQNPGGGTVKTNGNALGAGLFNSVNATSVLVNVTIASNCCQPTFLVGQSSLTPIPGFSAGDQLANSNGIVRIHNSLLAYAGTNGNTFGSITDDGFNISSDGSASFSNGSSYNFTDPKLGPLADNGGPTLTMSPLAISPAIDFGDSSGAPNCDQRGRFRPFGDGVDMGAVEYGSTNQANAPLNFTLGGSAPNLILNFTASPPFIYHLQSSTNLTSWQDVESIGAFSSPSNITRTISPAGIARKFFRVWYQ